MKRYQNRSYPQWQNLTAHLRDWKYGETADENPETGDQGADAMTEQHNLALLHGRALAENFDFSPFTHVLDLGGGTGAMSIGLCERLPFLRATVFDLPENIEKAKEMIAKKNLQDRIECVGGDVLKDALPENFDVALLANLLAVFDAETNKELFRRIYERLPAGGAALVSGWILDEARTSPAISVLFCLEDICWNAPDVERSFGVYRDWLKDAGFREIAVEAYFEPTKLISALKK
jgi:predicted O-methyltransferase YrrM